MESKIYDVVIKDLVSHGDERGFFREIIRNTDDVFANVNFAQWSHSHMAKNTVKAWHYHHLQYDFWYLPTGLSEVVLYDNREESPTYGTKQVIKVGDSKKYEGANEVCIRIPPGVLHACRVFSDEADLFYITTKTYNPNDEGRFPYNNGPVSHDWGENPIVVEKDTKFFAPTAERQKLQL